MLSPVDECVVQYLADTDRTTDLVRFGRTCRDLRLLFEQHSRWSNVANFAEGRESPRSTVFVLHNLLGYEDICDFQSTPTFMFCGERWRLYFTREGVYLDARDAPLNVLYDRTVEFFVKWCDRDGAAIHSCCAQLSFKFSDSHGLSCAKGFSSFSANWPPFPLRREFFDAHGVDGKLLAGVHITDLSANLARAAIASAPPATALAAAAL